MPRYRAVKHCQECPFYVHFGPPSRRHECRQTFDIPMTHDAARTSPHWCPLGHVIPGVPYPTFTPGKERA